MGFGIFALGMSVALVVQLLVGQGEIRPHGAVASTSDVCSQLGVSQLKAGGNAVDAAITTMLCMGITHPQYAGIGGGGLMVIHDHKSQEPEHQTHMLDFRETMPANYPIAEVKGSYSNEREISSTVVGGRAVGVPGEVKGMAEAHARFGHLHWSQLFAPIIAMARDGFHYSPTFHLDMKRRQRHMREAEKTSGGVSMIKEFFRELNSSGADGRVRRPRLAQTLESIARNGPDAFYTGPIADSIVKAVNGNGGAMSLEDLKSYAVLEREPLKESIGEYTVETFPAPASGAYLLRLLAELADLKRKKGWDAQDPEFFADFARVQQRAFACRSGLGDPGTDSSSPVKTHEANMLRKDEKTGTLSSLSQLCHGSKGDEIEKKGTSHIAVVDSNELMVSVSTSMNWWFGGLLVTETGILLNSHMADFDWSSEAGANAPQPGNRPLSGMSPTVVYHSERPCLKRFAIGGVNATKITAGVAQVTANLILFDQSGPDALAAPRLFCDTRHCQFQNDPRQWAKGKSAANYIKAIREAVPDGVEVELLEETTEATPANQQCNVVALAGHFGNGTRPEAFTDKYLDWGGESY